MFILFQSGRLNVKPDKTQVFLVYYSKAKKNILCWETK